MTKVALLGAGGHTRSVISLIRETEKYQLDGIYDDSFNPSAEETIEGIPVLGNFNEATVLDISIVNGVGDIEKRKSLYQKFQEKILSRNLVSKHAIIRPDNEMGEANQIFPFVFLNTLVRLGSNCILNSRCTIEHEVEIGNHVHVSVGAVVCGRVSIGNNCFIGAGSVIKDKVKICNDVTVGAGAVVIKDITEPGVYIGNPSRKIG